jgi:hypothetical protein
MAIFVNLVNPQTVGSLLVAFIIAYFIAKAISTYDVRLNQAKLRDFQSGVAIRAAGCVLPRWVVVFYVIEWVALLGILIINWKLAIALFFFTFILKVIPVLEIIGELFMKSYLMNE